MSMLSAAAMLDELMGTDRDLAPDQKGKSTHWSDQQVCKYHLCGFCPSELFINTRSDLGPCEKLHDDKLKAVYEKSGRHGQMGYEEEFLRYLQTIMTDVERRIRRGHARLIPREKDAPTGKVDNEKEDMLSTKINSLVDQVEQLGSEGKIEEAQGVMRLIDQLKDEKEQLSGRGRDNHMTSQEKQMEVCEVCGAFLIVGDAQTRVDDHLQGKQHMGYAKIKSTLEEMRTRPWKNLKVDKEKEEEVVQENKVERDRSSSRRERDRDNDRDNDRDRDRRRDNRDRGRGDRDRDRRRDRDRDYNRDRRRDRGDRDRDSNKEDSKRNDKDKSRRSRSRSRERSNKEKDGEKRRSGSPRRSESPN